MLDYTGFVRAKYDLYSFLQMEFLSYKSYIKEVLKTDYSLDDYRYWIAVLAVNKRLSIENNMDKREDNFWIDSCT